MTRDADVAGRARVLPDADLADLPGTRISRIALGFLRDADFADYSRVHGTRITPIAGFTGRGSRGSPRAADLANRSRVSGARIWSLPAGLEIAAIRVALNEIREIRVPE